MRIIFSRKGFDSSTGKSPSPIIDRVPISLPIPTQRRSETTYEEAGLGTLVESATKGRIRSNDLCHEDPVFSRGRWAFGQTGRAQSHLEKNGVSIGDVFIFFGLFASPDGQDRHQLIFGYLQVDAIRRIGRLPSKSDQPPGFARRHPHTIGEWNDNNTLYLGAGAKAMTTHPSLRLTKPGSLPSIWSVPGWLKDAGLTYHGNPARWLNENELDVAKRGQEFVSDISDDDEPRRWLRRIKKALEGTQCGR